MPRLEIEHNLCRSHLRQALVALAESEGLGVDVAEELFKALRNDTPRRPRTPVMAVLTRKFQRMHAEAKGWIVLYVDDLLKAKRKGWLRKSDVYKTGPLSAADLRSITEAIQAKYGFIAAQLQTQEATVSAVELSRWQSLGLVGKDVTTANFGALTAPGKRVVRNAFLVGRLENALKSGKTYQEVLNAALNAPLLRPDQLASARATDPNTSHQAAATVEASGGASIQRQKCLDALRTMHGATSAEIAKAAGIDRYAAARRLPELRKAGKVANGPDKLCPVNGGMAMTWWAVTP